jgi:hypothetical protein
VTRHKEEKRKTPSSTNASIFLIPHLTSTLAAADLATETGLDGGDGTTRSTGVAGDEVQTVLTLVELGVRAAAGLAGNVFDWRKLG